MKPSLLDLNPPERIVRRDFLKQLALAGTAAMMLPETRLWASDAEKVVHPKATADACIILWMAGGMAAPETFDPKRYRAYEKGVAIKDVLSTFPAIDMSVDNIKICEG